MINVLLKILYIYIGVIASVLVIAFSSVVFVIFYACILKKEEFETTKYFKFDKFGISIEVTRK